MTTKVRLIRLLSDIREVEHPPVRRTPLKPVMLYLMELRAHTGEAAFPKKKLYIPIESRETATIPQPVKITYLTAGKMAAPEPVSVWD